MQPSIQIFKTFLLIIVTLCFSYGNVKAKENTQSYPSFVSLEGQTLKTGNPIDDDGFIRQCDTPVLHLIRTSSTLIKGTILLLPGGDYSYLSAKKDGQRTAYFLNNIGFDVVILEYHIGENPNIRNLAMKDAIKAFRLLKTNSKVLGLENHRLDILGISSGGQLAARTVQKLGENEQPNNLILISPSYLDEKLTGTVFPAIMPPINPSPRLFVSVCANDNQEWAYRSQEYAKTWKGYDGQMIFHALPDSINNNNNKNDLFDNKLKLPELLKKFLVSKSEVKSSDTNPAAVAVEGYYPKRHAAKLELIDKHKFDLLFIGNSITHNFEKPQYQPVWNQFFAPRNAINLGYSGYRTENLIWNIQNGELDGQSPKVVILEIGTNNIDEKHYPTRHTAGQLADGIETIVKILREKLPNTKIIIMRCFPGCYGGPNPTSHRAILKRASDMVSKLADEKHIFYCDVNHLFINLDGSINHNMMADWLHPTPAGAQAWAQAMEPLLSKLMGDQSLNSDISTNSATIPVPNIENNSYDWYVRHADVLRVKDSINPEIILIGNSITHLWGGEPKLRHSDGSIREPNGPKTWDSAFHNYRVINMGFGWDRTQNVLWRLDHGEIDGLHPKTIIINIGTNNTSETKNASINTAPEIVEGIATICKRVRSKVPDAKIILMAVFPREENATHPRRVLINKINVLLDVFAKENQIDLIDISSKMLTSDGTLTRETTSDFCHPTEKGYQIWADAIRPYLIEL